MKYLIGTDEAGYGPNLGPLVISAAVWQVPDATDGVNLYDRLAGAIVRTPQAAARGPAGCIALTDSKVLYRSGKGLRHLERGLWAVLATFGRQPATWRAVWAALAPEAADDLRTIPWYAGYNGPVPLEARPDELEPLGPALRRGLAAADVRLVGLSSRAVFPREFNDLVDRHESKGAALSHLTLDLIARVIRPLGDGPISLVCDKHGGRDRYAHLLAAHFPDRLIEVHGEGRQQSVYRFGPPERRVEFRFEAKADGHLPAGLASMASKYLRELAMRALNDFWRKHVPGIRPTAGYPEDAKRFRADVAAALAGLGIDERVFWRVK